MTYKNRLTFLLSLIGALVLVYIVNLIITSNIFGSGSSFYTWLDSKAAPKISKIVFIAGSTEETGQDQAYELVRKNNRWFVSHNSYEYPARQTRIDDLISALTKRAEFPVRTSSVSSHDRFGVGENAPKAVFHGDFSVIMELLLGNDDIFKSETYYRKAGQNDVRSGASAIKSFLTSSANTWYNLRLITESESDGAKVGIENVQRVSVFFGNQTQIFTRKNRGWEIAGIEVANPSVSNIENYIRSILNMEGDNFADFSLKNDPMFANDRIVIEFGNARVVTIHLSEADESGRIHAYVSGTAAGGDFVYSIPPWFAGRIYRDASGFETQ